MLLKALILLSRRRSKSLWGPQLGEKPGDEVDLRGGGGGPGVTLEKGDYVKSAVQYISVHYRLSYTE